MVLTDMPGTAFDKVLMDIDGTASDHRERKLIYTNNTGFAYNIP